MYDRSRAELEKRLAAVEDEHQRELRRRTGALHMQHQAALQDERERHDGQLKKLKEVHVLEVATVAQQSHAAPIESESAAGVPAGEVEHLIRSTLGADALVDARLRWLASRVDA